jgi:hypothetical protein
VRPIVRAAAILGVVLGLLAGAGPAQAARVVAIPGLTIEDVRPLAGRAAIGLLVPGTGSRASEQRTLALIERGAAPRASVAVPTGPVRIPVEVANAIPPGDDLIVVGIPKGGDQPNDRRYAVAVMGLRGLLQSRHARVPGLVSVNDIAATALGREDRLRAEPDDDPLAAVAKLDRRIDAHNRWRARTSRWLEAATIGVAIACPAGGVLAVAAFLAMNLLLGAVEVDPALAFALLLAAALSGLGLARLVRSPAARGALLAAVLAAHLLGFLIDDSWLALSPLGPSQSSRFYGVTNLLNSYLLVVILAAVWLLARRPLAAAAVAGVALVTIAGSRFGADGGGAIVVAVAVGLLAALMAGGGRRAFLLALGGGAAVVALLLLVDAVAGPSSHVSEAIGGGPGELASDFGDRLALSWDRVWVDTPTSLRIVAELAVFAAVLWRLVRLDAPLRDRALPLAFAAAIVVSLLVNDSPRDVIYAGLAGYLAVEALALGEMSAAGRVRRIVARP